MRAVLAQALIVIASCAACSSSDGSGPPRPGGGSGGVSGATATGGTSAGGTAGVACTFYDPAASCGCQAEPKGVSPAPPNCDVARTGGFCCAGPGYPADADSACVCPTFGCIPTQDTCTCSTSRSSKQKECGAEFTKCCAGKSKSGAIENCYCDKTTTPCTVEEIEVPTCGIEQVQCPTDFVRVDSCTP